MGNVEIQFLFSIITRCQVSSLNKSILIWRIKLTNGEKKLQQLVIFGENLKKKISESKKMFNKIWLVFILKIKFIFLKFLYVLYMSIRIKLYSILIFN